MVTPNWSANAGSGRSGRSSGTVKLSQWIGMTRLAPVRRTSVSQYLSRKCSLCLPSAPTPR